MKTFGKQSHEAVLRRKREAGQRWKRRQTRQRLAFVFVMSIVALHIHSPMRSVWSSYWREHIDPLQLCHIFPWNFLSIQKPPSWCTELNTFALYAVLIKTCPVSLVSVYIALIAYVAITFCPIQHILEALLVHDCVYRDRHRSCYLQKC